MSKACRNHKIPAGLFLIQKFGALRSRESQIAHPHGLRRLPLGDTGDVDIGVQGNPCGEVPSLSLSYLRFYSGRVRGYRSRGGSLLFGILQAPRKGSSPPLSTERPHIGPRSVMAAKAWIDTDPAAH